MKRISLAICLFLLISACAPALKCEAGNCTRVLFVGNSYTCVNDLPNTFAQLANAGGHAVEVDMVAPGGATLADHVNSGDMLEKLKGTQWNYVVLQEQSLIPSVEDSFTALMIPAARTLITQIRQYKATPLLFITWAHRDGYPEAGLNSYEAMQFSIDNNYLRLGQGLNVASVPVGFAWQSAAHRQPSFELWQSDGSHPTGTGTYLAACVFYATIFHQSPNGLAYRGDLSKGTAQALQEIASKTVLGK